MKVRLSPFSPDLGRSADVLAGRYSLGARIGRGGAADVYRALDLRLRRPVAVKVFRPGSDPRMEERFSDEALLLARLEHPGLVTVYDTGQHEDRLFLVMQLVEGTSLRQRTTSPQALPWVCGLGAALASALAHVHAAGIVHRDVKPANVLLDRADNPHLTDFGISRLLDTPTNTTPGALIGTAAYLAPEQVLGQGAGTPADVYALGLALLECLKGELEYSGGPLEAATARLHRSPVLPPGLPSEVADLLSAMTSKEPGERPDAGACAAALAAVHDDAPAFAPAPVPVAHAVPAPSADPCPTHEMRATPTSAPAAPRGRRLLLTGAAALAAVLGATLTASDSAPFGGDGHATAPQAEPTPEAPPSTKPSPGASSPAQSRKDDGPASGEGVPGAVSGTAPPRRLPAVQPSGRPASHAGDESSTDKEQDDNSHKGSKRKARKGGKGKSH